MTTPNPKGFAKQSSIRGICEGLALAKRSPGCHWSYIPSERVKRDRSPDKLKARAIAALLAD